MSDIPKVHDAVVLTGLTEDKQLTKICKIPTVGPVPHNRIIVKVKAAALNPYDWKDILAEWGEKGDVVGCDGAGVVAAVGSQIDNFQVGDHVSFLTQGGYKPIPSQGALQDYAVVNPDLTIKYDRKLLSSDKSSSGKVFSFEGAASITLSLITVGYSFQHNMHLDLDKKANKGKLILIWGGATATGIQAIQVAKNLYGLTVVTVASLKHHKWLKDHGADYTFDYHDSDVLDQMKKLLKDNLTLALDTVSSTTTYRYCYQLMSSTQPAILDNLLSLGNDTVKDLPDKHNVSLTGVLAFSASGDDIFLNKSKVPGSKEALNHHLIFWKVAIAAVNSGLIVHPPLTILSGGYNAVNEGYSILRSGSVSAEKLIIRPEETV